MKWLVDTCVLSEFSKAQPEPRVVDWLRHQPESDLAISVLTVAEVEKGIHRLPDSAKKNRLIAWLATEVVDRFEDRILGVDLAVAKSWAQLTAQAELKGRPLPAIDGLIAATVLTHHLSLVTRDTSDLQACGVPLLNPWLK